MANDPAFLFYPGDYLRDTQCLSERAQVCYDRIMCEHMRNICITQAQLNFFTKRLTDEEKTEILMVVVKSEQGFQIPWVVDSIIKRREYSESRRKNRKSDNQKGKNISKSYVPHMDNEIENEDVIDNDNYIIVSERKVFDPMPIIEFYEAQLNGTQKENGNIAWRPMVQAWFLEHIGEEFKDGLHVKNSFKKHYIYNLRPNGKPKTKLLDLTDL